MEKRVRVRFAPSPTGGLHLGGVRTVLYNYLYARANGGDFVLRIEDTDQTRFVKGAEEYILDCLKWCGLMPDESPVVGGPYAPYRQSERKEMYREYAMQLVGQGHAYYAFDTTEELEEMRRVLKTDEHSSVQYDHNTRKRMRNSLTLSADEVNDLLNNGTPHVIRILVPENETIVFNDMIRGNIMFESNLVDDKVLLKADGMPTYHLAVVVDDYLMKITHAFRGEEWLPSAPVHLLLWQYLGWIADMPQWAHLPLILKPDGNGKLSKRDGDRLGFPVFAMNWYDPAKDETTMGFREMGFMPQAFVNMLAMLGWNSGEEKEIYSLEELVDKFSIDRVHKGGAKFDFEKAKWFNNQYIQQTDNETLADLAMPYIAAQGQNPSKELMIKVIALVKDRCTLLSDFWAQGSFFFTTPETIDETLIRDAKWTENKELFFAAWMDKLNELADWTDVAIEQSAIELLPSFTLKKGDIMLPLRIMLVGGKFGPGVYHIAELIGKAETIARIKRVIG
ncbi:glutamate--tRNA ligase [Flavipsychrobacter stenotrophus]|uniref:Glutamate--tRNA ligase n=1 Tax=Flavipsychrobacter stenotrophus TaxID=2077091 RepID=A0A2S7SVE4_9BACT|nr:glutamate--tRNA ligase [Flavipsychrobacter stenotrophus]PQJ10597.1 glutamate--tRNA ligase [Flavipsychrobacter stenotrophus]